MRLAVGQDDECRWQLRFLNVPAAGGESEALAGFVQGWLHSGQQGLFLEQINT